MNSRGRLRALSRKLKAAIPGDFQQEVGCELGMRGTERPKRQIAQGLGDGVAPARSLVREECRLPVL